MTLTNTYYQNNHPIPLLGDMTPEIFLKEYWQKKPLLIKQAFPQFKAILSKEALFALAKNESVESRLVSNFNEQWRLSKGPFQTQSALPLKEKKDWTLLIQGVNLFDEAANDLLRQFRFLPDARLDDLMMSYATEGGGVGPHFDSYDVFLLQAYGTRRWHISAQTDLSLVEDLPLKILKNFSPEQTFIVEPGDLLYLPPKYAHDGIALEECMTYSIGFRSPSFQEIGESFLNFMSETIELEGRYEDPNLSFSNNPAQIPELMLQKIQETVRQIQFKEEDVNIFLGEYLTEPKANVIFESPDDFLEPEEFTAKLLEQGMRLSLKTQMLYVNQHIFINGESFTVNEKDLKTLSLLANQRFLTAEQIQTASSDVMEAFCMWYEDGWVELSPSN